MLLFSLYKRTLRQINRESEESMISHEKGTIAFREFFPLSYLNVGVAYVDFLECVLATVAGAVCDAVAQKFSVNSIGMWWSPAEVYGTRGLVVGGGYGRFS